MSKNKKINIDEKIFIELYNDGKDDLDLAKLFKCGLRTVQYTCQKLRKAGKIKARKDLQSKTVSQKPANKLSNIQPIDWKIPKPNRKKGKEKPFKSYMVIADSHVPYVNEPAMKVVLSITKDINPDGFIILGDFMDMEPISHWLKNKKRTLENKRMRDDYIEGNKLLDKFDSILPANCDKRFFYGNHEDWYFQLIEEMPALEGLLEPKTELKLEERGYQVYDTVNHIERIGRLCFTHGIYHNQNYVKAHIDKFQTNVLHGDMHSPRFRCSESPAREIALVGYCLGCLCNLAPAYGKNRPNKWSHGFAVVHFFENGFFDVDIKRIVKGRCIYNNKLYDGNK